MERPLTILPPIAACPYCGVPVRTHLIETEAAPPVEVITEAKPKPIGVLRSEGDAQTPPEYEMALLWGLHFPMCRKMQAQGIGRKSFEAFGGMMAQRLGKIDHKPTDEDLAGAVEDSEGLPLPPVQVVVPVAKD